MKARIHTVRRTVRRSAPRLCAALALCAIWPGGGGISAAAAQGFYQVEIIVFAFNETEHVRDSETEAEVFDRLLVFTDPRIKARSQAAAGGGINIVPAAVAAEAVSLAPGIIPIPGAPLGAAPRTPLQPGGLLLQKISPLNSNPNYEVLRYQGWVQPSAPRDEVEKVRVWARANDESEMRGTVHIHTSGPYLQSEVDLRYRTPDRNGQVLPIAAPLGLAMDRVPPYHLYEQRRVRLREVHYYDHPKFGVLLVVTRSAAPLPLIGPEDSMALHPAAPRRIPTETPAIMALLHAAND